MLYISIKWKKKGFIFNTMGGKKKKKSMTLLIIIFIHSDLWTALNLISVSCRCVNSWNCSFSFSSSQINMQQCNSCSYLKPAVMRWNNLRKVWHNISSVFFMRMLTSDSERAWRKGNSLVRPMYARVRWRKSQPWRTIRRSTQRWPVSELCWTGPCFSLSFPERAWNFLPAFLYSSGNVHRHGSTSCTSKYAQENMPSRDTWTTQFIIFLLENSWTESYVELHKAQKYLQ